MKTLDERTKIYNQAKDLFGWDKQQDMVAEECSELIKAVMKLKRKDTPENRQNLVDEIADVEIMLEQLKNVYTTQEEIDGIKSYKVLRLLDRIKEHNDTKFIQCPECLNSDKNCQWCGGDGIIPAV